MKRALLIGCATYGLKGPENDVLHLGQLLQTRHGFDDLETLTGGDATRDGILGRYEALIRRTRADDVVWVHYSGHGCRLRNPDYSPNAESEPRCEWQFIVPTDMSLSGKHDFRGIMDVELSNLLAQLTQKTDNVTLVLDCCHASRVSRKSFRVRALEKLEWEPSLVEYLADLESMYKGTRAFPSGNPHALRLVACGVNQSAFEYKGPRGYMGLLSESLLMMLESANTEVLSWRTMGRWVRERVMAMQQGQRPDLEGPSARVFLQTRSTEDCDVFSFFYAGKMGQNPSLRGGSLHGVAVGNIYALMPADAERYDASHQLAEVEVIEVLHDISRLRIKAPSHIFLQPGLRAFLRLAFLPKRPVRVTGVATSELPAAIERSAHLSIAPEQGEVFPLAELRLEEDQYELWENNGLCLARGRIREQQVVAGLERLARAARLLELEQPVLLNQEYKIEWGRIHEGHPQVLPASGVSLYLEDAIFMSLHNKSKEPLYISIFNMDLDKTISLLTHQSHGGVEVAPGEKAYFGFNPRDGNKDWVLEWSKRLPPDEARDDHMVAFISNEALALSMLETRGLKDVSRRFPGSSRLAQLLTQLQYGCSRRPTKACIGSYAVAHFDFMLHPRKRSENR